MYDYAWAISDSTALRNVTLSAGQHAVSWHICMRMEECQWYKAYTISCSAREVSSDLSHQGATL